MGIEHPLSCVLLTLNEDLFFSKFPIDWPAKIDIVIEEEKDLVMFFNSWFYTLIDLPREQLLLNRCEGG